MAIDKHLREIQNIIYDKNSSLLIIYLHSENNMFVNYLNNTYDVILSPSMLHKWMEKSFDKS